MVDPVERALLIPDGQCFDLLLCESLREAHQSSIPLTPQCLAQPHPYASPAVCCTQLTHESLSEDEHSYHEKLPASSSPSPGSVSEITNTETVSVEMGKQYFGGCRLSLPSILNAYPTKSQDSLTLSPQEPICPICQKQAMTSQVPQVSPAQVDSWVHLCSGSLYMLSAIAPAMSEAP